MTRRARRSHHALMRHLEPIRAQAEACWSDTVRAVAAHPRRLLGVGAVCVALLGLVATTTLPMALAPSSPRLAAVFNSREPLVLQSRLEEARAAFLGLDRVASPPPQGEGGEGGGDRDGEDEIAPAPVGSSDKPREGLEDTLAHLPEASPTHTAEANGGDMSLRDEVRARAEALISADPLNPLPFRAEGEVAQGREAQRGFMEDAAKRSRRDPQALLWLAEDDLRTKRYEAALAQVDILLRASPQFSRAVFAVLGPLAEDAQGRSALVRWLSRAPQWRVGFFHTLNNTITRADTPFLLMQDLAARGFPPSEEELGNYLAFLLGKGFADIAYNVWIQSQPVQVLAHLGFLNNPSFEADLGSGPFDWRMMRSRNATGEFAPLRDRTGERGFHVVFGSGRVSFPQLSQVLVLPPGRYRMEGHLRGSIIGKRGLVWQVQCLYRRAPPLGQTEQLRGQTPTWRVFSLEFEVPAGKECAAQLLRLFHDARSASEEMLSGEVWFDDLSLERASAPTN